MLSLEEWQTTFSPCFRRTLVSSVFYLGDCSPIYFETLSTMSSNVASHTVGIQGCSDISFSLPCSPSVCSNLERLDVRPFISYQYTFLCP